MNLTEMLVKQLYENIGDASNIASSGITLVGDRCDDLKINPHLGFLALRVLVDKNIEECERTMRRRVQDLAQAHGENAEETLTAVQGAMQIIVDQYENSALKKLPQ